MSKPTLDNFEATSVRNLLDVLVAQANLTKVSHPEKEQHYINQIEPLAKRYKELTGQHYSYIEERKRDEL